ncbi:MAG: hypothetical protein PHY42_02360 [Bacilli bacterium]|nr:hypothetical protein [Bacilli bacterium]
MKTYREKIDLIKSQLSSDVPSIPFETIHRIEIEPPYEKVVIRRFTWRNLAISLSCLILIVTGFILFPNPHDGLAPEVEGLGDFATLSPTEAATFDPLPLLGLTSFYRSNRKLYQDNPSDLENESVQFIHYYLSVLDHFFYEGTYEAITPLYDFDYGIRYTFSGMQGVSLSYALYFDSEYCQDNTSIIHAKVVYLDEIYTITGEKQSIDDKIILNLAISIDSENYVSTTKITNTSQSTYSFSIIKDNICITESSIYSRDEGITLLQNKLNEEQSMYEIELGNEEFVIQYMMLSDRYEGVDPLYGSASLDSYNENNEAVFGSITASFDESTVTYSASSNNNLVYEDTIPIE